MTIIHYMTPVSDDGMGQEIVIVNGRRVRLFHCRSLVWVKAL
jgi:hypothetical protein